MKDAVLSLMEGMKLIKKAICKVKNKIVKWKCQICKRVSIGKAPTFDGKMKIMVEPSSSIVIGDRLHIRGPFYLKALMGGKIEIGDECFFNHNCSITCINKVKIGSHCKFGNNLVIVDHDHNFKHQTNDEYVSDPIQIGNNVWIGANVTILKGVSIGDNCLIAAGSIVRKNIPINTVLYQERKDTMKSV